MKVTIRSRVPFPARDVFEALVSPAAIQATSKPLVRYTIDPEPAAWEVGKTYTARMFRPGNLPIEHTIRVVRLDREALVFETDESNATAPVWHHHASVTASGPSDSTVTDTLDVEAGRATLLMAAFAHVVYRYRRYRLRGWLRRAASRPV